MGKTSMLLIILLLLMFYILTGQARERNENVTDHKKLTPEEESVIVDKSTEMPFTGKYNKHSEDGAYHCKRCGAPLFASESKFDSKSGWPSFDKALPGAVKEIPDSDGFRTEIVCANCGAHLGHVFEGENFTDTNTRHCVNSISLDFESEKAKAADVTQTEEAFFAGGCFWGVEYYLEKEPGVLKAESGYMGGDVPAPTYEQVCSGKTGHAETVRVVYDPQVTDFETLARLFMEIHDPTQLNRQGPDHGTQYRSAIFYKSPVERAAADKLIRLLSDKGFKMATEVLKAETFWKAEKYHQDYYEKTGKQPYCHSKVKRF